MRRACRAARRGRLKGPQGRIALRPGLTIKVGLDFNMYTSMDRRASRLQMKISFGWIDEFGIGIQVRRGTRGPSTCAKPQIVASGNSRDISGRLKIILSGFGEDNIVAKSNSR